MEESVKKSVFFILAFLVLLGCSDDKKSNLKEVDLVLDFVPNTNHTGIFVAIEYLKKEGIKLNVLSAPEDSTSDLVISGKAPFGIYFQESMGAKLSHNAPITAVAAIIEHNTSGILSLKDLNDLTLIKYGSWNDPVELSMIKHIFKKQGLNDYTFVPNTDSNSISSLKNDLFNACWVYYAWDGVLAKENLKDIKFTYLKDIDSVFDYYSPIIIANNEYLKNNKQQAKAVIKAIKQGYIYAMTNPEQAADILIKYAPNLKNKRNFIISSQKYLSTRYAQNPQKWGEIDAKRWNDFYEWLNQNQITKNPIPLNVGFSNEYLND